MARTLHTLPALALAAALLGTGPALAAELQLPTATPHFEVTTQLQAFQTPQPVGDWHKRSHAKEVDSTAKLSIEERRKIQARLKLRRKMVPIHQVLSFVAAGSIVAAEIVGMINAVALRTGNPTRGGLEPSLGTHRVLAGIATTTYFGAGIVAWTMPPALARKPRAVDTSVKKRVDSGKLHEVLSVVHGIAMGTVVATGILQANVATGDDWEALLTAHTIAGFTAASTVIGSGIAIGTL
jgi:hypothetical protein